MTQTHRALLTLCVILSLIHSAHAQQPDQSSEPETRQAEAVSSQVFNKLQAVQEATEAEDFDTAQRILNQLLESSGLSTYERAMTLQHLGFTYNTLDDTERAIEVFEQVLASEGLERVLYQRMRATVAQLCMSVERYADGVDYLEAWFALEPNPAPRMYALYGQALYQLERYQEMIEPMETAIALAKERDIALKEDWYALLAFAYFQNEAYRELRATLKEVLHTWPRKRYWMTLASTYAELGDDQDLVTTYSVSHAQDFLTTEGEITTMAQLYMQRDVPYKAAVLLESELSAGRIPSNEKNLRLLAQSWTLAQEDAKSLAALEQAVAQSRNADLHIRLGNAYLRENRFDDCVEAIQTGLDLPEIHNRDYAEISLGMCLYNLKAYDRAIRQFAAAAEIPRSRRAANEWIRVCRLDKERDESIEQTEAEVRRQQAANRVRQRADRADLL